MPKGPRCLRWRMVRPSGPMAVEFEEFLMASETMEGLKGEKLGSRDLWRILWTIFQVEGLDL